MSLLELKNTLVKNSAFHNFVLIYSTLNLEIYNTTFERNNIFTEGISYFIICEKNVHSKQIITSNNNGVNTTLIQVFS